MPDGPATPPDRDDEETEPTDLPRALAIASGGAYVAGLFIVNLDLARHGIWDVELGRPQYILVGVLWAVLNGLALAWPAVAVRLIEPFFRTFHPKFRPWYRVPAVLWRLLLLLFFLGAAEALAFMALVYLPLYVALGLQHVSGLDPIFRFYTGVYRGPQRVVLLPGSQPSSPLALAAVNRAHPPANAERPPKADSSGWFVFLPLGIFLLVMSVSLYTYSLYPSF